MAQFVTDTSSDFQRTKLILDAALDGNTANLQDLMHNSALSINLAFESDGATPLHIAAANGHIDIVRWIREKRGERNMNVKLNASGFTPLHSVISKRDPNRNAQPTQPAAGGNLQPAAAVEVEIVKELLCTGDTDANATAGNNSKRMTPLHIAASTGALEIVKLLLEWCPADGICKNQRIKVDAEDTMGSTALHLAAAGGHSDVVSELLSYYRQQNPPLDVAPTNKRRAMPLHLAALFGMPKTVEILLKFDAPVNRTAFSGHTPLHYAVFAACPDTVRTMLRQSEGLKVSEADWRGLSPLEYAKQMCRNISNDFTPDERKMLNSKAIVQYLEGFDVHGLRTERQGYMDSANAILVGAALIASITFSSWLQPPLGFSKYEQDYVAINRSVVGAFWVFNCISFFFAIASVVAGADAALPKRFLSLKETVVNLRRGVLRASWLLLCALIAVIGAFTCAGFADIPASKYWFMIVPTALGGFCCVFILVFFFKSLLGWDT